jgi:FGGY-family pentulose kinase
MTEGPYLLGIDMGTGGARAGIFDPQGGIKGIHTTEWETKFPRPGRAEQDPEEWWRCIVVAVRGALENAQISPDAIAGISVDSTSATVVAATKDGKHLRPALLWMDVRAADEAEEIAATGDDALKYAGYGAVSAEWGVPKGLWLRKNEPEVYNRADYIVDCTDWLVHRLTGEWTMSLNHAAGKYFYDRGWPVSLYEKLGATDLLEKFPERILPIGENVGGLRSDIAAELGLTAGTPVAEGAIDAYAGAIGLGVVEPGKMALITGSSHVMIGQSATPLHAEGLWGSYTDAVIPGEWTVEAGQVSTGSIVAWFRDNLAHITMDRSEKEGISRYQVLDELARKVPRGSDGLVMLDHFQGNRSPYSDPRSRGVFWGLTLGHGEGHMFRAILEGICFGTENIFETMRNNGYPPEEVVISGGPTASRLWMQMHADVSIVPITLTDVTEGPLLGSAMLAAVGAGVHADLPTAARHMVRTVETIEPDAEAHEEYQFNYRAYVDTYEAMKELNNRMAKHVDGA